MYCIPHKRKSNGSASNFYILKGKGEKRGFKSFHDYDSAVVAHYNQSYLSQHNLAPYVYSEVGRVRVGNTKALSNWGYVTEIASTIGCGGNCCSCCDRDSLEQEYSDEIDLLINEMEDYGFYFGDCHTGNVGYVIRNGQAIMVCIDTGDESVSSDHSPCYCLECKKGYNCRG